MSFFSVIIPVYNVEKYIDYCLKSILNQTFKSYEIILVDDGSTDSSSQICDNYARQFENIKVIHQKNRGLSAARNVGIDNASGEYIIFMDSDDYYNSNELFEVMYKKLIKNNFCDMVVFGVELISEYNGAILRKKKPYSLEILNENKFVEFFCRGIETDSLDISACLRAIKRKIYIENNIRFTEGVVCEDIEWFLGMLDKIKTVTIINKNYYVYRKREGSITDGIGEKNIKDLINIIKLSKEKIKNMKIDEDMKRHAYAYLAYQLYIVFGFLGTVDNIDLKYYYELLKPLFGLTKYSYSKKTKKGKVVFRIFGYRGAVKILGLKMKEKRFKKMRVKGEIVNYS